MQATNYAISNRGILQCSSSLSSRHGIGQIEIENIYTHTTITESA